MGTTFIKVFRTEHGDTDTIPIEVHLKYPDLYPAYVEPLVEAVAEAVVEVVEAVEAVAAIPTKIKKGK